MTRGDPPQAAAILPDAGRPRLAVVVVAAEGVVDHGASSGVSFGMASIPERGGILPRSAVGVGPFVPGRGAASQLA